VSCRVATGGPSGSWAYSRYMMDLDSCLRVIARVVDDDDDDDECDFV